MTIQEIEAKIERDYALMFEAINKQLCPSCNKFHALDTSDVHILKLTLVSAFLAGQIAGLNRA